MSGAFDIEKNATEVIRVQRQTFRGHDLIDIRVFYDAGAGELKPGKKGVSFNAKLLPEILEALRYFADPVEQA